MASRNPKNNLKTLLNAFRIVSTSTDDLAVCFARIGQILSEAVVAGVASKPDVQNVIKVLGAVLADMHAEDEAAKKAAEDAK